MLFINIVVRSTGLSGVKTKYGVPTVQGQCFKKWYCAHCIVCCCYFSGAQKGKLLKFHVTGSNQNFIGNIQSAKTEEPEELDGQSDKQDGRKS